MMSTPKTKIPADGPTAAETPPKGKRLRSLDRRRQIVRVASRLLAERGVDHVRMPEVAEAAGVTRAVVYRFFPSRQALMAAILEDFRAALDAGFAARRALFHEQDLSRLIRGFVETLCDVIDEAGPGGFILLNMEGPDPALAALSRTTRDALNQPWLGRLARVLDTKDETTIEIVGELGVASGVAVLMLYVAGRVRREEAVDALARTIRSLLTEFRAPR